jgi:hypothetical protein
MSIYRNIFHYYRGQTKSSSKETKQLQIENNVTKAFINVLQHSTSELTSNFLDMLGIQETTKPPIYDYRYQVPNQLEKPTKYGMVIGIAENEDIRKGTKKNYSIPDAAILSDDVALLIENKIGYNSYLEHYQLEGHKEVLALNASVADKPIILTWNRVRSFFKNQLLYFRERNDSITCFLLDQFEEFCIINCIGDKQKSKEYFFLNFEKLQAQRLAREIDDYIWNNFNSEIEDAGTSDGIGYRRKGKPKFATLTTARQRCLILHIGVKEDSQGLKIQEEIDILLGKRFNRKEYEFEKYPHEAYIRLEWVNSLDQIVPFIHQAFISK